MIVLAHDGMPPKTERWKMPYVGEQSYDWGYHGGRKHSPHGTHTGPAPHYYLDDPVTRERYFQMVREIVAKYKNDERICIWDVYNEPGNSGRQDITMPNLKAMFDIVREIDPSQPLTSGLWNIRPDEPLNALNQYALDNSDIISYHSYSDYVHNVKVIKRLKQEGRPIVNTEWLGRCLGNDVFTLFPLFYLEKIGCYNWGFVAGKYQTYEPWEGTWQAYENGSNPSVDFTKWFHDLYRPNHRPYDPREIKLIKQFCDLADKDFSRGSEP